jgi:hypothetical protein
MQVCSNDELLDEDLRGRMGGGLSAVSKVYSYPSVEDFNRRE